ncbi:MAG: acetyl-CoA carboxylase biotin carboxyl carrier protein, partial [Sphingomonas oligoaromativorans]
MTDTPEGANGAAMQVDAGLVRQLAELLDATRLTEIEVQDGDRRIRVARTVSMAAAPAVAMAPAAAVAAAPAAPAPAAATAPAAPARAQPGPREGPLG